MGGPVGAAVGALFVSSMLLAAPKIDATPITVRMMATMSEHVAKASHAPSPAKKPTRKAVPGVMVTLVGSVGNAWLAAGVCDCDRDAIRLP